MTHNPFDFLPTVTAGFASPSRDYLEPDLDYNQYFKKNPDATFALRVKGECMIDAHIPHNSIVVIDRSIHPVNNSIIIATVNGENMIKHLIRTRDGLFLLPANKKYKSMMVTEDMDFSIWGTVKHVIIDF